MSTAKHTPGPWAAFSDGNHTNIVAYTPRTACVFSLPGHHKDESDVRLIAAAPDMLEALESAVASLEQLVKLGRIPENLKGLRNARAAIAKATGQEGGMA